MVCNYLHQIQPIHIAATPNQTNPLDFPIYSHPNHVGPNNKTELGNPVLHRTIIKVDYLRDHGMKAAAMESHKTLVSLSSVDALRHSDVQWEHFPSDGGPSNNTSLQHESTTSATSYLDFCIIKIILN